MLVTAHLLAGVAIGHRVRRPAPAFALGLASHPAIDAVPHWSTDDPAAFLRVARADGIAALAVGALALRRAPRPARMPVVAATTGAVLLDLDKPGRHFTGRSPFPSRLDAWHQRIQRESATRWWVDAAAITALWLLTRTTRPRAAVPPARGRPAATRRGGTSFGNRRAASPR